jgi:rhamnulokinase
MKQAHCAAVDLGATSGRVIVGTWDGHGLALSEVHRFANQFRSLGKSDYWDVPGLWSEVCAGLVKAKRQFPHLASVGVDSWGVDYVLTDAKGRTVFPVHAYRDKRTMKGSEQLGRGGIKGVYGLTGIPNFPFNTSLQLQETLRSCPGVARVAERCLFIPDYFNFLLSGKMVNEMSISSNSQLIDVHGSDWSPAALRYFGIPRSWFRKPIKSPRGLGPVIGIPELKGVLSALVPGHDTACAFAAMPAAPDGSDLYLSAGTWSLLGIESDTPIVGPAALEARISNERMGDGRYRPLKNCLGLWLLERILVDFSTRPQTEPAWRRLIEAAMLIPAPPVLLDLADGGLFNPPSMRAAIDAQLKRSRCKPPRDLPGYVQLICRSLGRGHADSVRSIERLSGRSFQRILAVGGGSQNRLLCQSTADASGLPVASFSLEGSAVGNIAAQLVALGAVKDNASFRAIYSRQLKRTPYSPA